MPGETAEAQTMDGPPSPVAPTVLPDEEQIVPSPNAPTECPTEIGTVMDPNEREGNWYHAFNLGGEEDQWELVVEEALEETTSKKECTTEATEMKEDEKKDEPVEKGMEVKKEEWRSEKEREEEIGKMLKRLQETPDPTMPVKKAKTRPPVPQVDWDGHGSSTDRGKSAGKGKPKMRMGWMNKCVALAAAFKNKNWDQCDYLITSFLDKPDFKQVYDIHQGVSNTHGSDWRRSYK